MVRFTSPPYGAIPMGLSLWGYPCRGYPRPKSNFADDYGHIHIGLSLWAYHYGPTPMGLSPT